MYRVTAILNGQLRMKGKQKGDSWGKPRLDGGQIDFLMHHAVLEGT